MPKRVQFLTAEEEFDLARRWRDLRDVRARDRLVLSYRPFALRQAEMASRAGRGPLDDLSQEATLGLIEAAERFDPERGVRFAAFAKFSVQQRLNRFHFDLSGPVRVGTTQADKRALYRFPKMRAQWEAEHGRDLDDDGRAWIAREAGTSLAVLRDVEAHLRGGHVPLDAPAFEDGGGTVQDMIVDEEQGPDAALRRLLDGEQMEIIGWALSQLTERERTVVELRFGIGSRRGKAPEKQATVAALLGLSREGVRKVEKAGLQALAEMIRNPLNRAGRLASANIIRLPSSLSAQDLERARAKAKALKAARRKAERAYRVWARQAQMRLIDRCPAGGWVLAGSIFLPETRAAA